MSLFVPVHRFSSRKPRRRQLRRALLVAFGVLMILWAFGGGYLWKRIKIRHELPPPEPLPASKEQRAETLRAFDEAVRARFEERWQGVSNALDTMRGVDPKARGVDILIGEIALKKNDVQMLRQATERALRSGESKAAARLLQAVEMWIKRGEKGVDQAGLLAGQYLAEAAEHEPSNAAVHFFRGELNRLLGKSRAGQEYLQGALHRFGPWSSSDVISAKLAMASSEAGELSSRNKTLPPDTGVFRAAMAHLSGGGQAGLLPEALSGHTSQSALRALAAEN